eukprot:4406615-Amphidinium_carterae.1
MKEEPAQQEPETVPETPSTATQMEPLSIPTDTPASASGVQAPPEWDSWQTRILMPAPKPLVPDEEPSTTMPASKPFLYEMPIIPPDCLAETVDVMSPEFPVFGVWYKAMSNAPFPISRDAQEMVSYKPLGSCIPGFDAPVERMMELTPASGTHVFTPIQWNAECVKPPYPNFYLD